MHKKHADQFRHFDSPIDFKSVILNFESQVLQNFLDLNATKYESLMDALMVKNAQNSTGKPHNAMEKIPRRKSIFRLKF